MKLPLNFDLMKQPLNWAIVTLMVATGFIALNLVKTVIVKKSNSEG